MSYRPLAHRLFLACRLTERLGVSSFFVPDTRRRRCAGEETRNAAPRGDLGLNFNDDDFKFAKAVKKAAAKASATDEL